MKPFILMVLWGWATAGVGAMGDTEDPQQRSTKSWDLLAVKTLEIRGQVDFELVAGPSPRVTVETTRALFDQLTVSNWWGAATVAIESGLRGPRETGTVKVTIALPTLTGLTVSDSSNGKGVWPGDQGTIRVFDKSTVNLHLDGSTFSLETSWLTKVVLVGKVNQLQSVLRHQSHVDATKLTVEDAEVALDEESVYEAGPTNNASGTARHASRVKVSDPQPWTGLVLREDSVREVRPSPLPSN